jgi:aminoglycoside phosphotransferase (APT) family kinase protein
MRRDDAIERALPWAARGVGQDGRVVGHQPLHGGSSSAVEAVEIEAGGERHQLVLRVFTNEGWLKSEPQLAAREAAALRAAQEGAVPAPKLIAFDADGSAAGRPAVLMSRLPGRVTLNPPVPSAWVERLANTLAAVHGIEGESVSEGYRPWFDLEQPQYIPPWTQHAQAWRHLFERVKAGPPPSRTGFIHRDYHPGNVLWEADEVSGVVDWVNACIGPREDDVAHCRVNLAIIGGQALADAFEQRYCELTGAPLTDPYWDGSEVAGFDGNFGGVLALRHFGLRLPLALMAARLDEFVRAAAARC